MWLVCPSNSTFKAGQMACSCDSGFIDNPQTHNSCAILVETNQAQKPQACPALRADGNPIYPLTGAKKEFLSTRVAIGGIDFLLTYDSTAKLPANQADAPMTMIEPNSFGALWKSSLHHKLQIAVGSRRALLARGDGKVLNFTGNGAGAFTTDVDNTHKLVSIPGGYRFTDVDTGDQETFDSTGALLILTRGNGMVLNFTYAGENLILVQSSDGRTLRFGYTGNLITQITDLNGRIITAGYDANRNLVSLTWQDGSVSQFLYENPAFPWALTGKVDENGNRYATFNYDLQGRAISTEYAGEVNKFSVAYTTPPLRSVAESFDSVNNIFYRTHSWQSPTGTAVTQPNGQTVRVDAANVMGMPVITSQSQPAGSGCAASTSTLSYDVNGNIASKNDFQGQRSCYAYDSSNRETVRVEGLASTVDCSTVTPAGATLPMGARKIATAWHPDVRLPTQANQPLQRTTGVYNGQPDPFNSNAPASCAPAAAQTVDGKPIPVLCKQVEQATTDPDGSLGLAALIDTGAVQRTSSFTYDATGRTLTRTDPLNRVTTSAYYSASTGFSDSSVPSDSSFNSVSLLLHGDGPDGSLAMVDSSAAPKSLTATGNAKISTAQSKFGGASMYFDGARSYVSVPSSPSLAMGAADFTIEMWIHKLGNSPNTSRLWNPDGDLYGDNYLGIDASGRLVSYGSSAGSSWDAWAFGSGIPIADGVWKHVAVVRSGGTVTLYVDGVGTVLTTGLGTTALYDSRQAHVIGGQGLGIDRPFNGYIDDVRITKGVARYTANFTPPTQAFASAAPAIDAKAVGHTVGDLQSVTNAAGQVSQFTLYDGAGRVRQMVDAKGVVTDMAYTPRGWLSSVTVTPPGGVARTTGYSYDAVGQMIQASLADGTSLGYTYDAAHRLVGMSDAKGNAVTYTLDGMGNRVGEQVKDPQGNLQRNITRVYDALNRVQQVTGAAQ
jgi:YD repeat-containing protein